MANEDLLKLKIDKSKVVFRPRKRKKLITWTLVVILIIILALLFAKGTFTPAIGVQVVTVTQVYPSQAFTLLNASGYVVAQRKSALASKVTGRLIWLGVRGEPCKKGPGGCASRESGFYLIKKSGSRQCRCGPFQP